MKTLSETKPILFNTSMVQGILEGRKTQTRRIIKPQPNFDSAWKNYGKTDIPEISVSGSLLGVNNGKGGVGCCVPNISIKIHKSDILWVRETFAHTDQLNLNSEDENYGFVYKADNQPWEDYEGWKWKPSIYMPKAACRIFLEDTKVRVERLQDISEEDAIAEGVLSAECKDNYSCHSSLCINGCVAKGDYHKYPIGDHFEDFAAYSAIESFESLWKSINGKESWEENPWVWVYDFKRVEKPKNFI